MTCRQLVVVLIMIAITPVASTALPAVASMATQKTDTIVKQAGRPVHPGGGTLVPELSIGVVDGAQEYMFGRVRDILQTRDGSIFVVDDKAFAVRQYDAKGTYVRTLGRKGQGPGEYLMPGQLGELRDGRILLVDGGNGRVNVYARSGEPAGMWRLAALAGNVSSSRIVVDTTGTAILPVYAYGGGMTEGQRLLRFAPDGRLVDTIYAPVFAYTPPQATAVAPSGRGNAVQTIPFFPVTRWLWSPLGYMVTGVADRYAFELRTPRAGAPRSAPPTSGTGYRGPSAPWTAGDPVISIRHVAQPVAVSDEQRSVERTRIENFLRMIDPGWKYNGPDIPRVKPPYKDLRVGEDGTIWVQLSMPGERVAAAAPPPGAPSGRPALPDWIEPAVYDVFEPNGRYLGRVTRPAKVTFTRMTGDRVWAVARDDDDVEIVKRFRIDWR
jgi:hypothetical protein